MTSKPLGVVPATSANIELAARLIRDGKLVAFPTETVYGLGADATNDHAVAAIFAAKNRPTFNPLIVHVPDSEAARRLVDFDRRAEKLAAAFWPGALTLVLRRRGDCGVSLLASAGLDTLAIRVPRHPVAHELLVSCGRPVAAPSANRSGRISPTMAEHVARSFGDMVSLVLDGGRCQIGIESTVVDLSGEEAMLLRHGGISEHQLSEIIGALKHLTADAVPRAPGMLRSHYAPDKPLRIDVNTLKPGEALLAFGPKPLPGAAITLNLSPTGDLMEAAANLFAMLRSLDDADVAGIAVMSIPNSGLGVAINDRLQRAASSCDR